MSSTSSWHTLPCEMQRAIVDILQDEDVDALSKVDQRTYKACVPAKFKKVKLNDYEAVESFFENVPRDYCRYIEELDISTQHRLNTTPVLPRIRAETVISLLTASSSLISLVLRVAGSLDKSVITPFPHLYNLKRLHIVNQDDARTPLSERLVVSIAASVKNLEELSLERITRSQMHAPELEGVYPCPPLVTNDSDIPDHPLLGSQLALPSLLRIPTLRNLTIRDTHLGHEGWNSSPVACHLQVLDIGSCYHEDSGFNTRCTERIMAAVGPTIDEFSLTAAVSDSSVFSEPSATPLPRLRKLHISPFFPVDSVVETMTNLAGSPVEKISVQCFEEDVVDVCSALEEFLSIRVQRGPNFYHKLKQIDVSVTSGEDDEDDAEDEENKQERTAAAEKLQAFCRDLQLQSIVDKLAKNKKNSAVAPTSFVDAKRYPVKGRSNTL
ncbi:hypothetical protein CPC08DRAFT_699033 [Agrocybe pediades]|nr:hypothetical protein CPC08DRAFT_699033 [Agrocybe pediades]